MQLVPIKASPSCPTWLIAHVLFSDANSQCSPCSPVRRRNKSGLQKKKKKNLSSWRNISDTNTFTKSANTNTGLKIKQSPWQQRQDGQRAHSLPKLIRTLPQTHHPTHTNSGCFTTSARSCERTFLPAYCAMTRQFAERLGAEARVRSISFQHRDMLRPSLLLLMSSSQHRNSHMHNSLISGCAVRSAYSIQQDGNGSYLRPEEWAVACVLGGVATLSD